MENNVIGTNAGIVWNLLNEKKSAEVAELQKESGLSAAEFWAAIGWLSREEKLVYSAEKVGRKTIKKYTLA